MLVPAAARSSLGLTLFLRAIIGFFESATFPAIFYYFPIWVPIDEKTLMIPAIGSGMYMGEIIGFSLSGMLVESDLSIAGWYFGGWQSVFYVFGLLGVVWFPYWALFAYDSPEKHPYMTEEELRLINQGKQYTSVRQFEREAIDIDSKREPLLFNAISVDRDGERERDRERERERDAENPLHGETDENHGSRSHSRTLSHTSEGLFGVVSEKVMVEKITEEQNRTVSMISEEGREDAAARIPWSAFFTNKVSLTLFANSWVFVSLFLSLYCCV
jgi:hypothetical protein